jgi:hypothetical protein
MNSDLVTLDNLDERVGSALHGPVDQRTVCLHASPHIPSNLPLQETVRAFAAEPTQRYLNPRTRAPADG